MSGCTSTPPSASDHARIDHCEIGPGTAGGDIMNPTALSTNARIDHNHFHDVSGRHVITVGCCGPMYDYHDTNHVIEQNLFTSVRGGELISIKSSATTFRYNTIRKSGGDVDIRAGRHDSIYGNFIFGPGGGGIRMYEDDHRIYNNYVETGKALQMGPSNAGHAPIKNATVVFNTFIGSTSTSGTGNVITNNLVLGGSLGGAGNLGGAAAELGLVRKGELLVLTPTSKAVGAATGSFPFVTDDVAGHPREGKLDVGAEQLSEAPALRRPLTTADVGPDAP
jgi:poly(beta-D-mannuronate) lyase